MKKKLIICFMLVCVSLFVYQGVTLAGITGKIAGIITDASTGESMPAVNVVIEGTTLGGATDNDGHYFIINIPPGTYSLQASMVGYAVESKTGIIVNVDHTTPVDFDLRVTAIAGEEITVVAEREIVPMDISASQIVADAEQIVEVPLITDISEYIHLQAGIEGDYIRGGGLDQTQFMVDGLTVVDNRNNKPVMMVNLSAVKELNIIKGGFNAEYGNVRSGLINVITKEGSPSVYHGSFDFRISPSYLKHGGVPITDHNNYFVRSFLDPAVCWVGTENGTWDEEKQATYPSFEGWDKVAERLNSNDETIDDRTPEQCRDLFIWRHALKGSEELGQKEAKYADKPDWYSDMSFGGPVPYIGKYLGNLSFFVSHRTNRELYALPVCRDYFKDENTSLKLTSRLSSSMKLMVEGAYGEIEALQDATYGGESIIDAKRLSTPGINNDMYIQSANQPVYIYNNMLGISFHHVLSPSTFYNLNVSYLRINNVCHGWDKLRDTETIRYFGNTPVDESPYGYAWLTPPQGWGMLYPAHIRELTLDNSAVNTVNAKFDLTSQIDRYNQIKIGWMVNYDNINTNVNEIKPGHGLLGEYGEYWATGVPRTHWEQSPYRIGAYLQDKLEFEGMIANFGVRLDYSDPNSEWYQIGTYSEYFQSKYRYTFQEVAPKEPTKSRLKISPRIGVSHPISENAKLYFNYGHFYSMPSSTHMYRLRYDIVHDRLDYIGNPNLNLPRTTAYELGTEYNVANIFLLHLSAYYKDVSDQTSSVHYTSLTGLVDYRTYENNNYADIRGFELRIDKRFGRWITGWLNYDYRVTTSGYIGREEYYEDPREQRRYGLQNPYQERPLARPVARANLNIRTPRDWGPPVAGINPIGDIQLSLLFSYRSGRYETWDPLDTYELKDNIHWRGAYNFDMRLNKRMQFGRYDLTLFADIRNMFNIKRINTLGFADSDDKDNYLESLHLPMYEEKIYQDAGYISGNDKPGDIKNKDKPYINMPDREFLTYLNPRYITFGLKLNF